MHSQFPSKYQDSKIVRLTKNGSLGKLKLYHYQIAYPFIPKLFSNYFPILNICNKLLE